MRKALGAEHVPVAVGGRRLEDLSLLHRFVWPLRPAGAGHRRSVAYGGGVVPAVNPVANQVAGEGL